MIGDGQQKVNPAGYQVVDKFGVNDDIDIADTPVEIWSHGADGTNFIFLDAGVNMDLKSSDPNDTILGSGAQKVTVTFYLTDFTEVVQEFDMNGVTQVPVTNDGIIGTRMEATQTGSGNTNAGEINLVDRATGVIVYQSIEIGEGQTLSAIQICPKDKKGLVKKHSARYSKVQSPFSAASMRLRLRKVDGSILTKHPAVLHLNNPKDEVEYGDWDDLESGIEMLAGEIIFWECIEVIAAGTPVEGRFDVKFWDI